MEDDWESLAIEKIEPVVKVSNKWAGEDDEDDVKESWEDEEEKKDEEKSDSTKDSTSPVKLKPKLSKTKLAVKERLEEEEEAKRLENMTAEEKLAEKLRLQKIQEESDLNFALDTFGVSSAGIDSLNPQSKEDFKEFGANIVARLSHYKESPHFPQLIEDIVRNVCVNLSSADLKKVKITVETLYTEKLKAEKQTKKPAAKGKVKVSLKTDTDDIDTYRNYGEATADFDDYDDFM